MTYIVIFFCIVAAVAAAAPPTLVVTLPLVVWIIWYRNQRGKRMVERQHRLLAEREAKRRYKSAQAIRSMFP